jgi:hypothetical protein
MNISSQNHKIGQWQRSMSIPFTRYQIPTQFLGGNSQIDVGKKRLLSLLPILDIC